ncbi:MAG: hypothetical protein IKN50_04045, partial [Clostridia bacterium]|nr:hypothetical protein [Clostridia bacterium]
MNENYNSEPENIQNGEQKMALSVLKNVGSVLYRIFTVVINVFLTILLIGMITGVIVGTVFAMYIKNYIDPSIDTSLFVK